MARCVLIPVHIQYPKICQNMHRRVDWDSFVVSVGSMAGILNLKRILPSKITTLFAVPVLHYYYITGASATSIGEDESTFWIPDTYDNLECLPIELRDVFKAKNYQVLPSC